MHNASHTSGGVSATFSCCTYTSRITTSVLGGGGCGGGPGGVCVCVLCVCYTSCHNHPTSISLYLVCQVNQVHFKSLCNATKAFTQNATISRMRRCSRLCDYHVGVRPTYCTPCSCMHQGSYCHLYTSL